MRRHTQGFTLIEVLSSMAVLAILMLALLKIFNEASDTVKRGNNTVLRNSSARAALDDIVRDIEGAVIDKRLACRMLANQVNVDFDELFLVTTSGDQDDGRAYQLVHYYVSTNTAKGYTTYRLMKWQANFDIAENHGGDPLDLASKRWWNEPSRVSWCPFPIMIAENIVRLDFYVHDTSGNNIAGDNAAGQQPEYDSSGVGGHAADKPFGYIDVYLQVASEDVMKRASYLRQAGDTYRLKLLLDQESNILIRRGIPITGYSEVFHPLVN
jgi:prepilin-type N-terminal cleavage/methylation domain-containing protein